LESKPSDLDQIGQGKNGVAKAEALDSNAVTLA